MTDLSPGQPWRCSAAAEARGDDRAGTASTVRAYLLVENAGPWGRDALLDSRLPDGVGPRLKAAASAAGVRALLIRPGRRVDRDAGLRVFAAWAHPVRPWLESTVLADPHDLAGIDLAALGSGRSLGWTREERPLLAVCTHGKHDACCAERGRPVAAALREAGVPDSWEVSHIGGDRFAGNMVVLPEGLYYGGVDADSVLEVAAAHRDGRLHLPLLRGRSSYAMPVQFAEIALRRHLGESRLGAVRLRHRERDGAVTTADFEASGERWQVRVRTTHGEPGRLTCSALRDNPVPRHTVESIRRTVGTD